MKAVLCPVCKGKGRVYNKTIKTQIKCRGCDGKGWVEVHYAEVVPAPKVKTIPVKQIKELEDLIGKKLKELPTGGYAPADWQPWTTTTDGTTWIGDPNEQYVTTAGDPTKYAGTAFSGYNNVVYDDEPEKEEKEIA